LDLTKRQDTKISAGYGHTLAIDANGDLWAWGRNDYGQLGDGTTVNKPSPVQINTGGRMGDAKIVSVSTGTVYSLAMDASGNLWTWGHNEYGQIGDGTTTDRHVPVQVNTEGRMGNSKIVGISAGARFNLAIDTQGRLWAWGENTYGQLGDGTSTHRSIPVQVNDGVKMNGAKVIAASAGNSSGFAIDEFNNLWAWGLNGTSGALGDGTDTNRSIPVQVNADGRMGNGKVKSVSAGSFHALAIDEYDNLWVWGANTYGQLGDGNMGSTRNRNTPFWLNTDGRMGDAKVVGAAGGNTHCLAIDEQGRLWTWGHNVNGELGDGTSGSAANRSLPVHVNTGAAGTINAKIAAIAGGVHSLAIDEYGNYWAWGDNTYGQLGDGTTTQRDRPVKITLGNAEG